MWRCRCKSSWACSCSPDFLVGLRLRGAGRRLRQRADDGAASEIDLEGVVLEALGVAQQEVRSARERRLVGGLPAQRRFGRRVAPRLVRDAAERQTGLFDRIAFELQRGRDRYQRERIGEAIADFQIGVIRRKAPRRKLDRRDDLVRLQVRVALRRVLRAADGNPKTRSRAPRPARSHGPWRRARPAPRTCRRDASQCRPRSCRGSRACG